MKMKTLIFGLTLIVAATTFADVLVERFAEKVITAEQLDAVFDAARAGGISTATRVATTNLQALSIVPIDTNYNIHISYVPSVVNNTVTSTNGTVLVTRIETQAPDETLTIPPVVMQGLFDAGIGMAGDVYPPVTISNFHFVVVGRRCMDCTDWEIRIRLK